MYPLRICIARPPRKYGNRETSQCWILTPTNRKPLSGWTVGDQRAIPAMSFLLWCVASSIGSSPAQGHRGGAFFYPASEEPVGQVPDLPSSAPTASWQVGNLPHGASHGFHNDSEMPSAQDVRGLFRIRPSIRDLTRSPVNRPRKTLPFVGYKPSSLKVFRFKPLRFL